MIANLPLLPSGVLRPLASTCPSATGVTGRVARQLTRAYEHLLPPALVCRALHDAEELARETGFPDLFFPVLAEEKVRSVSDFLSRTPDQHSRNG